MQLTRLVPIAAVAVALLSLASTSDAQPHCIDCPTPPPCSAEGACHPKSETYGYYRQKWRRWHTDREDERRPQDAAPGVPSTEIPEAKVEDRAAPPPSDPKAESPADESGVGVRELDLPALPALPPLPGQPQPGQPEGPAGGGDDPPPGLPPLPGFGAPPGISPPPRAARPGQSRVTNPHREDAPPALPAGFAGLLEKQPVSRAGYQSTGLPSTGYPSSRTQQSPAVQAVSPAYYSTPAR